MDITQKTMKFALSIKLQLLFNFIINIMLKLVIYINGLLLAYKQWGTYETANASTKLITITFPVSFAVTAYSVALGHKGFSNWTNGANVNYVNKTVSDMTVYYCDGYGFSWLAIGM